MIGDFIHAHWQLVAELAGLFLILGVVVVVFGMLIAHFDRTSKADGIYFACITALTIGFGDIVPKTGASKIIAVILAMLGLIVFGIVVAVSVHALDIALESSQRAAHTTGLFVAV
jgi:voltage-gated potassium channel Kch